VFCGCIINNVSTEELQSISGARFKDAAPIAPSGWKLEKEAPWHFSAAYMYALT